MKKFKTSIAFLLSVILFTVSIHCQTGGEAVSQSSGMNSGGKVIRGGQRANTPEILSLQYYQSGTNQSASASSMPRFSPPQPAMLDPTTLYVAKSEDGETLYLSWNGDDPLFNVFKCYEPSFQNGVITLAKDSSATSYELAANSAKTLECFETAGASVVSLPVQGMGYEPEPAPEVPSVSGESFWWSDESDNSPITLSGNYLDLIPKGNATFMFDISIRAFDVTAGSSYATAAQFLIPDDARGFYPVVEAQGRSSDPDGSYPFVNLYPRGIAAFADINGVSFAPQTGKIWVADSSTVQEVDVFLHNPQLGVAYTGNVYPYISRVTTGGKILYVEGSNDVATVWQIDVSTGVRTSYAATKDSGFTRSILPRGIAVDPDGSACYIADGNNNKVVKIPAGAGSGTTIKDNWGNRTIAFTDPCGMDVSVGHQVYVSSTNGCIYQIYSQTGSTTDYCPGSSVYALEIDRDYSTSSYVYYNWSNNLGMCEAFNLNEVGSTGQASYHGAVIFGTNDGYLSVEPDWCFYVSRHFPQRVILNSSGQGIGYPSSYQSADRIIELLAWGWPNRPIKLRVIDPPDLSPYAPDNGCLQTGCSPYLPYEGNDNIGSTDYGICQYGNCSDGANVTKTLTCNSSGYVIFYLKVPERYSGDNFQVEVQKTNFSGGSLPQTRVANLSAVYTSWKRVFVERDKMFRKGGVLAADFNHSTCSPCNEIELFDWTNIANNDSIVIFDSQYTAESGGEVRTVTDVSSPSDGKVTVTLSANLGKDYIASIHPETGALDFAYGNSAGVGVLSGCDSASNKINASNSCFYEADMRDIEKTYNDAYVEIYALRSGMNAVPYLPATFFNNPSNAAQILYFGKLWFSHCDSGSYWECAANNYFHAMGCSFSNAGSYWGLTWAGYNETYIFTGTIQSTTGTTDKSIQQCTDHELGHQFVVNPCTSDCSGHDTNTAWCDSEDHCGLGGTTQENCVMNSSGTLEQREDGVNRFCTTDILLGISSECTVPCGPPDEEGDPTNITYNPPAGAIRTDADPQ